MCATGDIGASEIAKTLNIGRASVYRVLGSAPQPLSMEEAATEAA
jgi:helix-turn-helix resolvase-like protein